MGYEIEPMSAADFRHVVDEHPRYWGERDLRRIHLSLFVQEFAGTCFVARGDAGILGYLVGFVTPTGVGYIHLVATRDDARGLGVARRLYARFGEVAVSQGAARLKAITSVENSGSIAFHRSLGFKDEIDDDHNGSGRPMVVFGRDPF